MAKQSSKRVRYVDERGRFVSKSYTGKVFKQTGKGYKIFVGSSVPKKSKSDRASQADYALKRSGISLQKEHENIKEGIISKNLDEATDLIMHTPYSGNPSRSIMVEKGEKEWLKKLENYEDTENLKSTDDKFVFNYSVQKTYGYTEQQQKELYNLFKMANERIEELRDLMDADIGKSFSFNMNVPKDVMERRASAALEILQDNYVEKIAKQYKEDFLENYKNHLTDEDFERFSSALESIDDIDFLKLIKQNKLDANAYSLDSVLTAYDYEYIKENIDVTIYLINKSKK